MLTYLFHMKMDEMYKNVLGKPRKSLEVEMKTFNVHK